MNIKFILKKAGGICPFILSAIFYPGSVSASICPVLIPATEDSCLERTFSYICITGTRSDDPVRETADSLKIEQWMAGETIEYSSFKNWGSKKSFLIHPISDAIFRRIYGKSYKKDCSVPREDLRYLTILHYNFNGEIQLGELICHKNISEELICIFKELFENHYPIEKMLLVDAFQADDEKSMRANNTSCFNFRRVSGSNVLSNHSTGHAIDINPLYNPYVKHRNSRTIFQPQNAQPYINRSKKFPHKIDKDDLCYKLFKRYGFIWGGEWNSVKDYQHFEKKH